VLEPLLALPEVAEREGTAQFILPTHPDTQHPLLGREANQPTVIDSSLYAVLNYHIDGFLKAYDTGPDGGNLLSN
jgi:hypothetical protein